MVRLKLFQADQFYKKVLQVEAYEIMVTFNEDEFDDNGQIKADRLFYYFQEASSGDVNKRGVGPDDLCRNNQPCIDVSVVFIS